MKKLAVLLVAVLCAAPAFAGDTGIIKLSLWGDIAVAAPNNKDHVTGIDIGIGSSTQKVDGVQVDLIYSEAGTVRGVNDDLGEVLKVIKVPFGPLPVDDPGEDLEQALVADAAWGAFAAGFIDREGQIELGDVDHAVVFVHDDHAAGAHHGTRGHEAVVVDRGVQVLFGEEPPEGPPVWTALNFLPPLMPPPIS